MKQTFIKSLIGVMAVSMFAVPSAFAATNDTQSLTGEIEPGTRDIVVLKEMNFGLHAVQNNLVMSDVQADAIQIDDFTGSQNGYTMSVSLDNLTHSTEGSLMADAFNLEIGTDAKVLSALDQTELMNQNTVNINSSVLTGDLFTMNYGTTAQDELGRMITADSTMKLSLPLHKTIAGSVSGQVTYNVVELD